MTHGSQTEMRDRRNNHRWDSRCFFKLCRDYFVCPASYPHLPHVGPQISDQPVYGANYRPPSRTGRAAALVGVGVIVDKIVGSLRMLTNVLAIGHSTLGSIAARCPFGGPSATTSLTSWHTQMLFVGTNLAKLRADFPTL